jgi:hypothetical protein
MQMHCLDCQRCNPVSFHVVGGTVTIGQDRAVIGLITRGTRKYPQQVQLHNGKLSPVFDQGRKPEAADALRQWIRANA